MLSWKDGSTPSFESPGDVGGDEQYDNIYVVTVVANSGELKLSVEITDVEEEGSLALGQPQPQVGIQVSEKDGAVSDGDGEVSATKWQWSKSMDVEAEDDDWMEIEGAKSSSYTPAQADAGYYLRLTATYNDRRGEGKTAMVESENAVDAKRLANASPAFAKEDVNRDGTDETGASDAPFMRSVKEGLKGGFDSPVVATDADSGDIVLHTISGPDAGLFNVDERSGQLSTKDKLNYENAASTETGADPPPAKTYLVQVTGTDSSLAETTVTVHVEVLDVNEAPTFAKYDPDASPVQEDNPVELTVVENSTALDRVPDDPDVVGSTGIQVPGYVVADQDSLTVADDPDDDIANNAVTEADSVNLTTEGPDGSKFKITDANNDDTYDLEFDDHTPNYEKQNEYEVHIVARDENRLAATRIPAKKVLKIKVTVSNLEEDGSVSLDQIQTQAGIPVTAELSDSDGGVRGLKWQWSRQTEEAQGVDGGPPATLPACPAMAAPVDADATNNVGNAWIKFGGATDDTYTPGDDDVPSVVGTTYTYTCLQATATYKDDFDEDTEESASSGLTTTQVTDLTDNDTTNDPSDPTLPVEARPASNEAPKFGKEDSDDDGTEEDGTAANPFTRSVKENSAADFGETVGASDGDGDPLLYEVDGVDSDSFGIDRKTGQLKTTAKLDFENPMDSDEDGMYMLTVTAKDPSLAPTTVYVMVTVTDVDDKATVALISDDEASIEYAEDRDDAIAVLQASDEDVDTQNDGDIEWSLKEADDHGKFMIDENDDGNGVLSWKDGSTPSFESPGDVGGDEQYDNIYEVTVVANVGTLKLLVEITDVEEDGSLTLGQPQPQVGIQVSEKDGAVSDGDGEVSATKWQWSKSMDVEAEDDDWMEIEGAKSSSYTPAQADAGYYLRLTATYSDRRGEGKTAMVESENTVDGKRTANAAPAFAKEDVDRDGTDETGASDAPFMRSVKEGLKGGFDSPVVATDADSGDIVLHTISGPDAGLFNVDERSGQLSTKDKLNYENAASTETGADPPPAKTYLVQVTGTDSSLAETTVTVHVEVLDVNEAPTFAKYDPDASPVQEDNPVELTVVENSTALDRVPDDPDVVGSTGIQVPGYVVADQDSLTVADDPDDDIANNAVTEADSVNLTTEGPDGSKFKITDANNDDTYDLEFDDHTPNYEKQNEYEVHIVARDENRLAATRIPAKKVLKIKVTVSNLEEDGSVSLDQIQTQAGVPVNAELSDSDGGVRGLKWQWSRQTVSDNDPADTTLPNCPAMGMPMAVDADNSILVTNNWIKIGGATDDTYTPGDDDVPSADGATLTCLQATATYKDDFDKDTEESASSGLTAQQITDVEGDPTLPVEARPASNEAPKFGKEDSDDDGTDEDGSAANPFMRSVKENSAADFGETVGASDGDGDPLLYEVGGVDSGSFGIDRKTGQLKTTAKLDFENPTDSDEDGVYMLMVTAKDPSLAPTTVMVMVTVTDVDDKATIILRPADNVAPAFADDAATEFMVYENAAADTAVGTVTADDPGDTLTYTDDSGYFDVDDMGNITTTMMLDHEAMASHTVTITVMDDRGGSDSIDVTINVGDMHPGCTVMDNVGLTNDCEALLDAKGDLGGDLNWDTDTAMADWEGVSMSDGRVSGIWLKDEGLDGSVSAALGRLDMLTVLNLHSNSLSGTIPDLSGATMLEGLYLAGNADYVTIDDDKKVKVDGTGLTGEIPMWLNGMTNLTNLWLWGNQLTGGIPDLSGLTNLDKLKLADNDLSGNINAMYLPQNVSWLIIDRNGFDGSIPDLSGLTSLRLLWLHTNELTGAVPDGTMLPASLDDLNLRDNMLMGAIPDLSALDNLTRLRLHNNSLSGAVPGSLGGLDSLKQLWLHNESDSANGNNMFTSIDDGVGGLSDTLIEIALSGNMWADDACVPAALADVDKNDYEAAGIAVCGADDGS